MSTEWTGPDWLEVVGAASGEGLPASEPFWYSPADDLSRHFVDLQRDQTVQDVLDAVGGGLRSVEHVKRATYIGTAIDQGRTSGVLTADPRVVPRARPIPRLSYAEAAELAYFGARVLHPKTIQPAMEQRIPVRICNSRAPEDRGTVVTAEPDVQPETVKAIAHKTGVTVLQITSTGMLGAYGFLRALFEVFDRYRTVVDVVTTSEVSVSLTLEDVRSLPQILGELRPLGDVSVEPERAIVCVVGEGLRTTPGIAARIFTTVRDINVSLISQGASRVNLTFVIAEDRVRDAVRRLHEAFFEREPAPVGAAVEPGG